MEAEGSGYLEQGEGDGLLGAGFKDHLFITSWGSELCDEVSAPVGLEKQADSALASVDPTPGGGCFSLHSPCHHPDYLKAL